MSQVQTTTARKADPTLLFVYRGVQLHPSIIAVLIAQFVLVLPALLQKPLFPGIPPKAWMLAWFLAAFISVPTAIAFVFQGLFKPVQFCKLRLIDLSITVTFLAELLLMPGRSVLH